MNRGMFVVALLLAGLVPATAAGATAGPTLTPEGPATVSSVWGGAHTTEGLSPRVLTAVRVTVAPGGNGGPIRLRVTSPLDPDRGTQLGPWVDLPAAPGTYEFAAPPLRWDYRSGVIAIDQQVGGHAIVFAEACRPESEQWSDPCRLGALAVFHDPADGDPAVGTATTPPERYPGQRLTVTGVMALDGDGDRVPDVDDRTDLRVTATRHFAADGTGVLRTTIHNAGPRAVDRPLLITNTGSPGVAAWAPACLDLFAKPYPEAFSTGYQLVLVGVPVASACRTAPLPAGARRTTTATLPPVSDRDAITVRVAGDGDDLAPADNTVEVAPPPVLTLRAAQAAGRRVHVVVRTHRAGRLRLVATAGGWRSSRTALTRPAGRRAFTIVLPRRAMTKRVRLTATLTGDAGVLGSASTRVGLRPSR